MTPPALTRDTGSGSKLVASTGRHPSQSSSPAVFLAENGNHHMDRFIQESL
jgi:hypothetical protein